MTPGTNYPVQDQSVWLWTVFLGAAVLMTLALMCLFIWEVYRTSQATLPEGVEPPRLPSRQPPAMPPTTPATSATSAPGIHSSGRAPAA